MTMAERTEWGGLTRLLARYSKPYRPAIAALLLLNLLLAALTAITPLLIAPIVDIVLGAASADMSGTSPGSPLPLDLSNLGRSMQRILGPSGELSRLQLVLLFGGIYIAVGALRWIVHFAVYLTALQIRVRSSRAMQLDLFRHIMNQPMSFFTRHKTGDLMSRLDSDTMAIMSTFDTIVTTLIVSPILILVYGALLFNTSPFLALTCSIAGVLHYVVSKGIETPIRRLVKSQHSLAGEQVASLQESLSAVRVVKSFGAENFEAEKLGSTIRDIVRVNIRHGIYKHIEEPVRGIVNLFIEVAILILGATLLLRGDMTPAAFLLFLYVGRSIVGPIASLGSVYTLIQQTIASAHRVVELFDERSHLAEGTRDSGAFSGRLAIENVSFAYETDRVLERVSLTIEKGSMVALVGASGAGKSTLTDLLLRFHDPEEGRITLDGVDIREFRQASYRSLFGVVSQECLLFNASVRDNIAYGRPLDEETMIRAARIANAHEFILELPKGYDTLVGDRGIKLSGGQRQRLAIARAVYGKPEILVLDEATSALDSESERLVQEAIERAVESTTAIVIAHRLSTIRNADQIVVFASGRIEAAGRHDELMVTSATYRRLHDLQFDAGRS